MAFTTPELIIDMLSIETMWAGSIILAYATHAVCNRWEPSLLKFLVFTTILESGLFWLSNAAQQVAREQTSAVMLQCNLLYFGTLISSIVLYRLYFHPLREYPGPVLAKLTKFYTSYKALDGKLHLWLEQLHAQYGETVRFGPNELSFVNPEDVAFIQGSRSGKLRRGPWYDGSPELIEDSLSMARTRNVEAHKLQRRIWEQAFTQSALANYIPKINNLVDQMVKKCGTKDAEVIDISGEIDNFAFDAMGILGFSRDYGMISGKNAESKIQMQSLGDYMTMLGITRPVPWFKLIYRMLPIDSRGKRGLQVFVDTTIKRFEQRYAESAENKDILSYLMLPEPKSGIKLTKPQLIDESISVVIAGSDTTSICLTFAIYFLLKDTKRYSKLLQEVDSIWDGHSPLDASAVTPAKAPYLEGVINESLRLAEPDPNGNQRQTPKGGLVLHEKHIPEYTQVSIHKWSMQRYENNFSKAHEFIPERWISDEERDSHDISRHEFKGFIPFGAGVYSCVGKQLALIEMRLFLVGFLRRLDISPDPDYDLAQFPAHTTSHLTLITPALPALVRKRRY